MLALSLLLMASLNSCVSMKPSSVTLQCWQGELAAVVTLQVLVTGVPAVDDEYLLTFSNVSTQGSHSCYVCNTHCILHWCADYILHCLLLGLPSMLWHCRLGFGKSIRPVKNWVTRCWHGYLSGGTNGLHMVQLMPLPPDHLCFIKLQIGLTFLVWSCPDCPGKEAVNRVFVHVSGTGVGEPSWRCGVSFFKSQLVDQQRMRSASGWFSLVESFL